jgi:hypothetical protein
MPFAPVLLASRWDEAQFPNWSEGFIDKLLTDSPWAHPWKGTALQPVSNKRVLSNWSQTGVGLPLPIPGGGRRRSPGPNATPQSKDPELPLRVAVDLIIRWASALPIRRAMALQEFGRGRMDHPQAVETLSAEPKDMVIVFAGIPHLLVHADTQRELEKARLILPGHRPLTPLAVSIPSMGVLVTATLRFPRIENLAPQLNKIDLITQLGTLRIEESFKPQRMVYEGRLEL